MTDAKTPEAARASRKPSGKRRRVAAGDLLMLQRELWYAVRRVSMLLDDADASPDLVIKAANSLGLLSNSYSRLTETAELAVELREVKARIDEMNPGGSNRWAA